MGSWHILVWLRTLLWLILHLYGLDVSSFCTSNLHLMNTKDFQENKYTSIFNHDKGEGEFNIKLKHPCFVWVGEVLIDFNTSIFRILGYRSFKSINEIGLYKIFVKDIKRFSLASTYPSSEHRDTNHSRTSRELVCIGSLWKTSISILKKQSYHAF